MTTGMLGKLVNDCTIDDLSFLLAKRSIDMLHLLVRTRDELSPNRVRSSSEH